MYGYYVGPSNKSCRYRIRNRCIDQWNDTDFRCSSMVADFADDFFLKYIIIFWVGQNGQCGQTSCFSTFLDLARIVRIPDGVCRSAFNILFDLNGLSGDFQFVVFVINVVSKGKYNCVICNLCFKNANHVVINLIT